jgi:serine/threonine protein kinase
MVGETIAHYKILEKLGEGGMGVVYKAEDIKLKRTVALKFLPAELVRDPQAKARFLQEARAAAALDHPNICTIHEINEAEGRMFIVMAHMKGPSLKDRIAHGPMALDEALDISTQVAEGLRAAHEKGIIHRDIKPANVMLTEKGQAKVMDFGLAKLELGPDVTRTMAIMGTVAYMSPEQARGETVDHRTDIWSFGAMLYEMLTGEMPFGRKLNQALLYSIMHDPVEPPSRLRKDLPKPVEHILLKALEKDKLRRYPSVDELLKDLKAARSPQIILTKQEKSIIVLPFEDMSPGKDNEYFSDGMTEEIIADLSKIHSLRVISRTSAMMLKGTRKDVQTIARELSVEYVLEGSVRKAGNNLRITAQLIDAVNDAHIWAEKYSGTLDDVFDIQENVSRAIVATLKLMLSPNENHRIAERPMTNVQAYDAYLRARQEIARWTEPALDRALRQLESALEIAGDNAALLAGLALVHLTYATGAFRPLEETLEKAKIYATQALQIDSEMAPAHTVLGIIAYYRGDMRGAFALTKRAVSINPNDPDAVLWFVHAGISVGRCSDCRSFVERILQTDPLNSLSHVASAVLEFYDGRFEASVEAGRAGYELDDKGLFSRGWCCQPLLWTGRFDEAQAILDKWQKDMPGHLWVRYAMALQHAIQHRKAESQAFLQEMLTEENIAYLQNDTVGIWAVADICALNGETEEALRLLEHGLEIGCFNYAFLSRFDPYLANIRGEERFQKLMERVKYEWEHFEV